LKSKLDEISNSTRGQSRSGSALNEPTLMSNSAEFNNTNYNSTYVTIAEPNAIGSSAPLSSSSSSSSSSSAPLNESPSQLDAVQTMLAQPHFNQQQMSSYNMSTSTHQANACDSGMIDYQSMNYTNTAATSDVVPLVSAQQAHFKVSSLKNSAAGMLNVGNSTGSAASTASNSNSSLHDFLSASSTTSLASSPSPVLFNANFSNSNMNLNNVNMNGAGLLQQQQQNTNRNTSIMSPFGSKIQQQQLQPMANMMHMHAKPTLKTNINGGHQHVNNDRQYAAGNDTLGYQAAIGQIQQSEAPEQLNGQDLDSVSHLYNKLLINNSQQSDAINKTEISNSSMHLMLKRENMIDQKLVNQPDSSGSLIDANSIDSMDDSESLMFSS
jgi:hypothetical protein